MIKYNQLLKEVRMFGVEGMNGRSEPEVRYYNAVIENNRARVNTLEKEIELIHR